MEIVDYPQKGKDFAQKTKKGERNFGNCRNRKYSIVDKWKKCA